MNTFLLTKVQGLT